MQFLKTSCYLFITLSLAVMALYFEPVNDRPPSLLNSSGQSTPTWVNLKEKKIVIAKGTPLFRINKGLKARVSEIGIYEIAQLIFFINH